MSFRPRPTQIKLLHIVQSGGNRNRAVRCRIWENMRVAVCLQFGLRVVDPKCRLHAKEEMLATAQLLDWILDGVRPVFTIRIGCRRQPPVDATIVAKPRRTWNRAVPKLGKRHICMVCGLLHCLHFACPAVACHFQKPTPVDRYCRLGGDSHILAPHRQDIAQRFKPAADRRIRNPRSEMDRV